MIDFKDFIVHKKKKLIAAAAGLTPEVLMRVHEKFIAKVYMKDEKLTQPQQYISFLEDLSEIEQKALIFYAYTGMVRITQERATREAQGKKKIILPKNNLQVVK